MNERASNSQIADAWISAIAGQSGEKIRPSFIGKDRDYSFLVDLNGILPLGGIRTHQADHVQVICSSVVNIIAEVGLKIANTVPLLDYHRRNEV